MKEKRHKKSCNRCRKKRVKQSLMFLFRMQQYTCWLQVYQK